MSGLEIAGLLLGAIPTCATAIAEYNSTLDKIKRFRHWRLDLPRYVGILRRQRSELEETLRLLLFGMVDSDGLEIMIEDPVGSHWKNEALISKLKGKYREEYDIFEERIRDISSPMFKLTARLGLTKTEYMKVSAVDGVIKNTKDADGSYRIQSRLSFAFGRNEVNELLNQIHIAQD